LLLTDALILNPDLVYDTRGFYCIGSLSWIVAGLVSRRQMSETSKVNIAAT
jgi:hypothetical protein